MFLQIWRRLYSFQAFVTVSCTLVITSVPDLYSVRSFNWNVIKDLIFLQIWRRLSSFQTSMTVSCTLVITSVPDLYSVRSFNWNVIKDLIFLQIWRRLYSFQTFVTFSCTLVITSVPEPCGNWIFIQKWVESKSDDCAESRIGTAHCWTRKWEIPLYVYDFWIAVSCFCFSWVHRRAC